MSKTAVSRARVYGDAGGTAIEVPLAPSFERRLRVLKTWSLG